MNVNDHNLWRNSRKEISVYKFYYQQVIQDDPVKLCGKLYFLKKNNIKIAIEWPISNINGDGLGSGLEGFSDHVTTIKLVNRIKSCNEKLDYVVMDEPLFFGSYLKKNNTPNLSVDLLAKNLSVNVSYILKEFPNVEFGDIEPIDQLGLNYKDLIYRWIHSFQEITGAHMAFFHDDVIWADNWMKTSQSIYPVLKDNNTRFGIIFNAKNGRGPDDKWMESNRENVKLFFSNNKNKIDDAIFQSWNRYPNNIDDERDSNSHISIIGYFMSFER
ncbi:hypothetical protein GCM10009413_17780 [Tatumella punctata]|uniref:hypothetical protein n=1 Tax=Tatumella punctata TaxID=399969 RepID=UPI0031D6C684